jgi:mRNA-degrading endonuclease RelE of RelBE toxin-antitoxin system
VFSVHTTPRFERLLKKLSKHHPDLVGRFAEALAILEIDPYNRSRSYPIKKLADVPPEEGQYRLRSGHWRFRYNIWNQEVELTYCGLRREETYD